MTDKPIKPIANPIGPNAKQPRAKRNVQLKRDRASDLAKISAVDPIVRVRNHKRSDKVKGEIAGAFVAGTRSPTEARPSRETKKSLAISLLRTKAGITISELSTALGWQQHTTRATLSGMRKAGFAIVVERPAGGSASNFRIVDVPEPSLPSRAAQ